MADWCSYLTFDVIGELFFGKTFGMLEKSDNRWVLGMTIDAGKLAFIVSHNAYILRRIAHVFPANNKHSPSKGRPRGVPVP
jgi:hypothetical protein